MKAITICQPYAWLITAGEKPVENRTWSTRHRGPLATHAGKSRRWLDEEDVERAHAVGDPLVFGAIVATCDLVDCVRINDIECGSLDARYPQLANRAHCFGPWCWVLANVRRPDTPVPWRGAQGLFEVPDRVMQRLCAQPASIVSRT